MAFVSATPVVIRPVARLSTSSFSRRTAVVAPMRRAAVTMADGLPPKMEKIPQGFTLFSEKLNGRAAMMGFILALVTEALTGKGILGQVNSIFEIVNTASALSN